MMTQRSFPVRGQEGVVGEEHGTERAPSGGAAVVRLTVFHHVTTLRQPAAVMQACLQLQIGRQRIGLQFWKRSGGESTWTMRCAGHERGAARLSRGLRPRCVRRTPHAARRTPPRHSPSHTLHAALRHCLTCTRPAADAIIPHAGALPALGRNLAAAAALRRWLLRRKESKRWQR